MKLLDKFPKKKVKVKKDKVLTEAQPSYMVKEEKKKMPKSAIVLIVGLAIIAIPCIVFLVIILSATFKTGTPISGDRFKNDLVNEISKSQISDIVDDLEGLSNVEKADADYPETGRLVIYVDANDSLSASDTQKLAEEAYETVIKTLPVQTYFTATDTAKMYDLTINVYTTATDSANRTFIIVTKNSNTELPSFQNVAVALDENLAKELRGETSEEPVDEQQPAE